MKVIRSIISPSSIVQVIKQYYTFLEPVSCHLIKGGGSNDIYKVIDKKCSYIFKIYSVHPCWEYKIQYYLYEMNLQNYLYTNHMNVSKPIKNKFDSFITDVSTPEYKKFCVLTSYLEGGPWDFNLLDTQRAYKIGKNLADMHSLGKKYVLTNDQYNERAINLEFLLIKPYQRIQRIIHHSNKSKSIQNIYSYFKELKQDLSNINWDIIESGIVHGDMHILNHLYNNKNKKVFFIDFEFCGYGYPIYDVATFKGSLLSQVKGKAAQTLWDSFLEGYLSIRQINSYALEVITIFIRLRHLFYAGSTFIAYSEYPQNQNIDKIAKCLEDQFYLEKLS